MVDDDLRDLEFLLKNRLKGEDLQSALGCLRSIKIHYDELVIASEEDRALARKARNVAGVLRQFFAELDAEAKE